RIYGDEFIAFAQFELAHNPEIGSHFALPADAGFLNHFDKWLCASVQNWQLEVVEFHDGVIDARPYEGRQQVFGGGDQNTLLHQTGGVGSTGDISAAR